MIAPEIRVVIADDHPLFRKGMVAMLNGIPGFAVAGEAVNGAEAIDVVRLHAPDVVLMDLHMPEMGGILAIREIRREYPSTRILVVTMFEDDDSVFLSLRAGAHGYVLKDAHESEFERAIRAVASGEAIFSPAIASRVIAWFSARSREEQGDLKGLTPREREILGELAQGHSNATIARHLDVSAKTVANHLSTIFSKLQVNDRGEAIVRAREAGFGSD